MSRKYILENHIRVVTEEVPWAHSAALGVWVGAGSRYEEEVNQGVSHFLEHLLFKGTKRRTARQIAEEIEAVGGVLNAYTTKEYTCFHCRVLAEYLDLAVDVLADMLFNSLLLPEEVEKEKNVVLEEIKMYEDTPDELVHDLFAGTVWEDHPLGWAILGTCETVRALNREEIYRYYQEQYHCQNIVIAVTGRFQEEKLKDKLEKTFGQKKGWGQPRKVLPPQSQAKVNVHLKETEQVQICLGVPGLAQGDEKIYALQVLNNVLGGGISSRLFQLIREEKGLVYSVYSYHTSYSDSGLFTIYAGTSPQHCQEVVELILEEIASLKEKDITPEELKRTKDQIRGQLLMSQENLNSRLGRMGRQELTLGRVISTEEMIQKLEEVDQDKVGELARELFQPERFSLTTLGPASLDLDLAALARKKGI